MCSGGLIMGCDNNLVLLLTWKQASVANSLAIEQSDIALGPDSSSALAALRTNKRDATRLEAISATLNCKYYTVEYIHT